jgi:hypothetical protein
LPGAHYARHRRIPEEFAMTRELRLDAPTQVRVQALKKQG